MNNELTNLKKYIAATSSSEAIKAIEAAIEARELTKQDVKLTKAGEASKGTLYSKLKTDYSMDVFVRRLMAINEEIDKAEFGAFAFDMSRMVVSRKDKWYKHFVSALTIFEKEKGFPCHTACINQAFELRYDPDFMLSIAFSETVYLLSHESEHVMFRHLTRYNHLAQFMDAKSRKERMEFLNLSADMEIDCRPRPEWQDHIIGPENKGNYYIIKDDKIVVLMDVYYPENGLYLPKGTTLPAKDAFFENIAIGLIKALKKSPYTAEEIRQMIKKAMEQYEKDKKSGKGKGDSGPSMGDGSEYSDQSGGGSFETETDEEKQKKDGEGRDGEQRGMDFDVRVKTAMQNAMNEIPKDVSEASARGIGRGLGMGVFEGFKITPTPTPISKIISNLVGYAPAINGQRFNYRIPHAVSYTTGIFEPSRREVKREVAFALDTSGSVSDGEMNNLLNTIHNYRLINMYSNVHILFWECEVYKHQKLRGACGLIDNKIRRGGTIMSCVADYIKQSAEPFRPALMVYLTDGGIESKAKLSPFSNIILVTNFECYKTIKAEYNCPVYWVDLNA